MGKIVCQFGIEHGRCRCRSDHVETRPCNTPAEHSKLSLSNTEHGTWVKKDTPHDCIKPTWYENKNAQRGDQWKCNACNTVWEISKVKSGYDPRPGEGQYGWFDWVRRS